MKYLLLAALFARAILAQQPVTPGQINTVSGNGHTLVTTTGSQTSGNCVTIDANGNHVAAGAACASGGGVSTFPSTVFSVSGTAASFATGQTANRIIGTDGSGNVALMALTATQVPAALSSTTSVNGTSIPSSAALTQTIASGTAALGTGSITSGACATVVTSSATGAATTDNVMADFNADPTSTTGYAPSTNGMLTIIKYPTANNVNFKVCNNTGASITPGAITLNWRVVR